ncbi:hypothetical protein D3C78_1426260 [compost metagenome]
MLPELARLVSESRANNSPEAMAHNRPVVASLARSKSGVTSTRPTLTSSTNRISLARMRSRKTSPSSTTVKAGKLAKPRVAMATPATLTAMKKLTQCPASSNPLSSRRCQSRPRNGCQPPMAAKRAKAPKARTANAARPNTMMAGEALASLPNTPVRPKNSAPICSAPRAER